MTAVRFYGVCCDVCGFLLTTGRDQAASARRVAGDEGWTHPRANPNSQLRIDKCPQCSKGEHR